MPMTFKLSCGHEITEAEILSYAAKIWVSRRKHHRGGRPAKKLATDPVIVAEKPLENPEPCASVPRSDVPRSDVPRSDVPMSRMEKIKQSMIAKSKARQVIGDGDRRETLDFNAFD